MPAVQAQLLTLSRFDVPDARVDPGGTRRLGTLALRAGGEGAGRGGAHPHVGARDAAVGALSKARVISLRTARVRRRSLCERSLLP